MSAAKGTPNPVALGLLRMTLDRDAEIDRLTAALDAAQRETASHLHAALFAAGIHGGPGAWRWASDPADTILDDVAAWERLLGEIREQAGTPEPVERKPVAGWRLVDGRLELSVGCESHAHGQMTAHVGEVEGEHFYEIEVDDIEGSLHEFAWGGRFATLKAAQLAAEDALFAIANAINALRSGL